MSKKKYNKSKTVITPAPSVVVESIDTPSNNNNWAAIISIFVIAMGLYVQTYSYEYVLDDTIVITDNSYVKKGFAGIGDIFSTESFQGYFGEQKNLVQGSRYRPLSIATFAMEYSLWGANPAISHVINAVLYGLTCILLFLVLSLLFSSYKSKFWFLSIPFVASLLYAIHPLHIEAVANIKGRDEIMAMIFSLWSMWFFIKSMSSSRWLNIGLSALLFFVGLMAKENTITFLAIIPAGVYFFKQFSWKDLIIKTSILLGVTILYIIIRTSVIGFLLDSGTPITDVMNNPFAEMNTSNKMATIFYTLGIYFKLSFFPHPLTHDYYPYHIPIMNWSDMGSLGSLLLYIGLGIYTLIGIFKKWVSAYALFVYFAALSIVSNIFVGVGTFMNERFLFMASMGTCILAAHILLTVLPKYLKTIGQYVGYGLLAVMVIFYIAKDFSRIPAWKDALALNSAAVKVSKNSARSNSFMATALFNKYKTIMGQNGPEYRAEKERLLNEALPYALQAKKILPQYKNANLMLSGIAAEKYKMDRNQTALLREFKSVIITRPDVEYVTQYLDYINSRSSNLPELNNFYYDVAYESLFMKSNNTQWAIHYLELGLKADPNNKKLHQALGKVYQAYGNTQKAQYHLRQ